MPQPVGAAAPIPREVVGALSGWVNSQGGPTHTQLDEAILNAGINVPEAPNKPTKVRRAFEDATPEQGRRLVEELIHIIRDNGYWDHHQFERNNGLTKAAVAQIGGTISDEGFLTWDYSAGDAIAAHTPTGASPIVAPRTGIAVPAPTPAPAPPLAQASDPTVPSHERLLWFLRRVPASFSALVRGRRAGHAPLVLRDEYDLQDATETALRLLYDDVRPEERTPSYAGSSTTQDFLLREVNTMVEIKVTRPGRGNVQIRDEILIDSETYRAHPNVDRMVFVVFDIAGTITNAAGFERDLSSPIDGYPRDTIVVPWPYPA